MLADCTAVNHGSPYCFARACEHTLCVCRPEASHATCIHSLLHRSTTRLFLGNVTAVLDPTDFLSLLSLARVGLSALNSSRAQYPTWTSLQNPVLSSITVFNTSS